MRSWGYQRRVPTVNSLSPARGICLPGPGEHEDGRPSAHARCFAPCLTALTGARCGGLVLTIKSETAMTESGSVHQRRALGSRCPLGMRKARWNNLVPTGMCWMATWQLGSLVCLRAESRASWGLIADRYCNIMMA